MLSLFCVGTGLEICILFFSRCRFVGLVADGLLGARLLLGEPSMSKTAVECSVHSEDYDRAAMRKPEGRRVITSVQVRR